MTGYQFFVYGTWERPEELWRVVDDRWEYLSLVEWRWLARDERVFLRHPDALSAVTAEQAAELEGDRQRLVRYWVNYELTPPVIYRHRRLPSTNEMFGRDNNWTRTSSIHAALDLRTSDPLPLEEIDVTTAERIVQETRGITGATELGMTAEPPS